MQAISKSDQSPIIAFLSTPASYGPEIGHVEKIETHGSIVFLAGAHAYKLKRAVHFPYIDYSTIERRREMCLRELALNRRTAPALYLATRPIVRKSDVRLDFGSEADAGSAMDWVVVMRRFDQNFLFEQMRRSGQLSEGIMRVLAETIADFHQCAEAVPTFGGPTGISQVIEENCALLAEDTNGPVTPDMIDAYCKEATHFQAGVAELLDYRRQRGDVRRCHGDLHLNNICMWQGRPMLFDAIEFNDTFSCIDVMYDLAFLLMDLERHELRDFANVVLNRYLELSDQHDGLAALPLYISCRAAVRAHTALAVARAVSDATQARTLRRDAGTLLHQAIDVLHLQQPQLVAVGGVSGTGKSTLAKGLAPRLGPVAGAIVLRSDIIRKRLMGVPETTSLSEDAYAPLVSEQVYQRIQELARTCLNGGYAVVADAVYGKETERRGIAQVAKDFGVRFTGLWLEAATPVLETRLAARRGDVSDATVEVMRAQVRSVEPPVGWLPIPAASAPSDTFAAATAVLGKMIH